MISSIVLLNQKGDILILRAYKDDVGRQDAQNFCEEVVSAKELKERPILNKFPDKTDKLPDHIKGVHFMHVTHGELTLVATTKENANATLVFEVLYKTIALFKAYFGGLTENDVRRHFVLIYELLDEIIDYGYPQILEPDVLKKYITQGGVKAVDLNDEEQLKKITIQATGNCSWRGEGIKYKKNEVYIDVVESVNVLLSNKGSLLRADVSGQIMVKSLLSGMPECKFGMNDKLVMPRDPKGQKDTGGIVIDDCRFHQCVRLSKYDSERTITFTPPDGVFSLMEYRITENIQCPFKVIPVVQERGRHRLELSVKIRSLFESNIFATDVQIEIPAPKNTAKVRILSISYGKAKYEPQQDSTVVWRIRKFPGNTEYTLLVDVELAATVDEKVWQRPPIGMNFQVPMFTASGLRVRFLRVHEKSNYKPIKWIRYVTKAGSYQHRI